MVKLRSAFAFVAVALALIEVCTAGFAHDVSLHVPLGAVLSRSSQPEALLGRGLPSRILTAKAVEEQAVEAVEKTIFIKATPEECFRVASGYEDYPKWAKATAGVSVLSRENGLGKQVEMRMGMFGIEVKSIFEYNYNRPTQMEWTSVGGTIKELYGRYTFVQEGEGTQVTYKLSVQPPFPLPGYIKKATNRAICATALGELRSYTENPKTLAKVRESIERELGPRKSGGGSTATASHAHAHQQKVWEDVLEICFTSHSSTW